MNDPLKQYLQEEQRKLDEQNMKKQREEEARTQWIKDRDEANEKMIFTIEKWLKPYKEGDGVRVDRSITGKAITISFPSAHFAIEGMNTVKADGYKIKEILAGNPAGTFSSKDGIDWQIDGRQPHDVGAVLDEDTFKQWLVDKARMASSK